MPPRRSTDPREPGAVRIEAERAAVRALLEAYRQLNHSHFRSALRTPQIALSDAGSFLGRWLGELRTLELSRALVAEQPWGVVLEVLKHEMAHQYVQEVARVDETPHGPSFRALCARLGIDERASGLPARELDDAARRVLDRVHKLLALAESDNRNEAESAAAAAQRLMLRHNLSRPEPTAGASYGFCHLGRITGRVAEWERRLGNLLAEHFFVEVIWVPAYDVASQRHGSVLEAIGTRENLDLAAYVHDFLARTGERLWVAHKRAHGIPGDADRRAYLAGVVAGFAAKLAAQARVHTAEGLVWVPNAGLAAYTRRRHPRRRTVSFGGNARKEVFAHGHRAGREVVLHKGIAHGAGPEGPRKLLRG